MIAMAPHRSARDALRVAQTARLTGCGFTGDQAKAIAGIVHAMTEEAVEALQRELMRWHAYLALYLLGQIGIVLAAVLLIQGGRQPRPRPIAGEGRSGFSATVMFGEDLRASSSPSAEGSSCERATVQQGMCLQSFGALSGMASALTSLQSREAVIHQDSTCNEFGRLCDSTLRLGSYRYSIAATTGRHHTPKLDCDRPYPRVSRLIRHLDYGLA